MNLTEKHQLTLRQKLEIWGFEEPYETDAIIKIVKEWLESKRLLPLSRDHDMIDITELQKECI